MLDTLVNVKLALMVVINTDDLLLTRLMTSADAFIAEHTGRDFVGGTFTEIHAGGRAVLFTRNYPIASVTSVKVDPARQFSSDTVRAADTYVIHANRGAIESLTGPFLTPRSGVRDDWPGTVQVVYATATSAVPAAVKEAFTQLIGHWYRQAKTFTDQEQQMLLERSTGLVSSSNSKSWSWSLVSGVKIPPVVLQLLELYRVPPM